MLSKALQPLFLAALCTLASCGPLHGNITPFLQSITDKDDGIDHTLPGIDFIYMINLDERPEKFQSCIDQLHPLGIYPYRFSAVNGWKLSFETINSIGVHYEPWMKSDLWGTCYLPKDNGQPHHEVMAVVGRNYFCHCMSRGAIGINLSQLSILQDAYDSGYETIWVMEDDIEVIQDPHLLTDIIKGLDAMIGPKKWDILFTDFDTKDQKGNYISCKGAAYLPNFTPKDASRFSKYSIAGPECRGIGARYGAYSMIVRRSGMKKILDFFNKYHIFLPFDMTYNQPDDIKLFTVMKDVVSTQPQALSDNGGPNYENK